MCTIELAWPRRTSQWEPLVSQLHKLKLLQVQLEVTVGPRATLEAIVGLRATICGSLGPTRSHCRSEGHNRTLADIAFAPWGVGVRPAYALRRRRRRLLRTQLRAKRRHLLPRLSLMARRSALCQQLPRPNAARNPPAQPEPPVRQRCLTALW